MNQLPPPPSSTPSKSEISRFPDLRQEFFRLVYSLAAFVLFIPSTRLLAQSGCDCNNPSTCDEVVCVGNGDEWTFQQAMACSQLASSGASQDIYIHGTLVLEEGTTYIFGANSTIIMGSEASIEIENAATLIIWPGSIIRGCQYMWERINVQSGGTLRMTEVSIGDGHYAVVVHDNSRIQITDCEFKKNYIGIYSSETPPGILEPNNPDNPIDPEPDAPGKMLPSSYIHGTTFTGGNGNLKPYTGEDNLASDVSYVGILLNDMDFVQIGNDNVDPNIFYRMNYGIFLGRCNADIRNCTFDNIRNFAPFSSASSGIFAGSLANQKQYFVSIKGLGKNGDATFGRLVEECVFVRTVNIQISQCFGSYNQRFLYLFNNGGRFVKLIDNKIIANTGIFVQNPQGYGNHNWQIKNNLFELNNTPNVEFGVDPAPAGIDFYNGVVFTPKGSLGIHENEFIIEDDNIPAIKCFGCGGLRFNYNTIDVQTSEDDYSAIHWLGGVAPNTFAYNTISGDFNGANQSAFFIGLAKNNSYHCNTTTGLDFGFKFIANCANSNFSSNYFGEHEVGLELKKAGSMNANIGPQLNTMNAWENSGSYGIAAARHHTDNQYVAKASLFDVHTSSNPWFPDPLIDPSGSWFKVNGSSGDECTVPVPDDWYSKSNITFGDSLILLSDLDSLSSNDQWMMRYSLGYKLIENSDLLSTSAIASQWFSDTSQLVLLDLIDIEMMFWNDLVGMDSTAIDLHIGRSDTLISYFDRLLVIDSFLLESIDSNLIAEQDSLVDLIHGLREADSLQWIQTVFVQDSILIELQGLLDSFYPSHYFEDLLKQVYGRWVQLLVDDKFMPDSIDQVTLSAIASLCIGEGGPAVYLARGLEQRYLDVDHNDELLCIVPEPLILSVDKKAHHLQIDVYPNPVDNILYIKGNTGPGKWILMDAYGREVLIQNMNLEHNQVHNINLESIASGIYIWKFYGTDTKHQSHGLLVRP